jgi:hypothetical protein
MAHTMSEYGHKESLTGVGSTIAPDRSVGRGWYGYRPVRGTGYVSCIGKGVYGYGYEPGPEYEWGYGCGNDFLVFRIEAVPLYVCPPMAGRDHFVDVNKMICSK